MADLTPLVRGPDGVYRETFSFSTTQEERFFTGTMDADTVDMEVSINGAAYTSDPDYILFEGTSWTVPNPTVYPDGMEFLPGTNTILIRALFTGGSASPSATITATLVQESDVGLVATSPTNISVDQKDGSVEVQVEGLTDTAFQGFNFYASQYAGGGSEGYQRINIEMVSDSTMEEETTSIATMEVDSSVLVDGNGDPVADPLYFRMVGTQEDEDEDVLQEDFDERYEVPESTRTIRTTASLLSVENVQQYVFDHSRTAGANSTPPTVAIGEFASVPDEDPLYYVITALYYDEASSVEVESAFSQEVVGRPLKITTTIGNFPVVSRQQIVRDFAAAIFRSRPEVRVEEGSSLRDTVIDPFSSEAERVRFIVDFMHRAQSPTQLLAIDDPKNTGTSAPVATSAYKQALKAAFRMSSDAEVQSLINACCDSYASKVGVFRRAGFAARGEATFYTTTRPTRSIPILLGSVVQGGSVQFRTLRAATMSLNNLASYYNPVTGRYSLTLPIRAASTGSSGVVAAGQIRTVVSSIPGISVVNAAATFGGQDQETNHQLIERAVNRLASVDSGTERGYLQTVADVAGVLKAFVVAAGDDLMQRDLDAEGVHRGGKVDIWMQGENTTTVTDTFAFSFEIGQDIQFEILGSPSNLLFKAVDSNLSLTNPIVEMLDYPDAGYEFRNASTGEVFDLTGVTITSYNTIQLDNTIVQPTVDLTDVVLGSYRRQATNSFTMTRQPVSSITAVVGVVSGTLPTTAYGLYHPDAPLLHGRSTLAQDYLSITPYTDSNGNTVPSGDAVDVENEQHVVLGEYTEYLDNLGANFLTIEVWNQARTIQYKGPNDPSGDPDFTIILGTQTTPVGIRRVTTGDIASGATVSVDYSHDENFTVTYQMNLMVVTAQNDIDDDKHATADALGKASVPVPLQLAATVVLDTGVQQDVVDKSLRTNLTNFITNLRQGAPVRQSDVIRVIERTVGVSYVVVPLTVMVRGEGSTVVREALTTDLSGDVTLMTSLSSSTVLVWILDEELNAATTNGGGPLTDYRGVFRDDVAMTLLEGTALLPSLNLAVDQAYIIGAAGAVIQGYSDDTTLTAAGFTTATTRAAERLRLTANKVLVSALPSDSPVNHDFAVTYVVASDTGAKNLDLTDAEYVAVPTLDSDWLFTYDEDSE